jgi:hypothetical protein
MEARNWTGRISTRGDHRIWGRQDYDEPPPLPPELATRVASCAVTPRRADRTECWNWHEVRLDGKLIGYVTTRLEGQQFRTADMEFWCPVQDKSSPADLPHARAILHLLDLAHQ